MDILLFISYFETLHRGLRKPNCILSLGFLFFKACETRADNWANEVRIRLNDDRCQYDLHTADAPYHKNCGKVFRNWRNISFGKKVDKFQDEAFDKLTQEMRKDISKSSTSVELHEKYMKMNGCISSRRTLIEKVKEKFSDKLLVLSSPGIADIIIFMKAASKMLKIEDREDIDIETKGIAKKIVSEIFELQLDADTYDTCNDVLSAKSVASPTLAKVLSEISKNELPETSPPNISIGNVVTKFVRQKYTAILIDLAVMIRKEEIVAHLYEYKVACSNDELKRFRSSVACDASERINQNILKPHTERLVQAVADNFDCNISSMNGLKQTHSLAIMMLQTEDENCEEQYKIKRLTTAELKDKDLPDINFVQYKGSKKLAMPKKEALQSVLPLSIISKAVIS